MVGREAAQRDGRKLGLNHTEVASLVGANCWFAKRVLAVAAARACADLLLSRVGLVGGSNAQTDGQRPRAWRRYTDFSHTAHSYNDNLNRGARAGHSGGRPRRAS